MMKSVSFSAQKANSFMSICCPLLNRKDLQRAETFDLVKVRELIALAQELEKQHGMSLSSYQNFLNEQMHFYMQRKKVV